MELSKLFNLSGRTAIVTGGAGLLGVQFCRTLAQAGAQVLLADRNGPIAQTQARALEQEGLSVSSFEMDVTDPKSVEALVSITLKRYGRLDILVNSAALDPKFDPQHRGEAESGRELPPTGDINSPGAFETFPLSAWNEALEVNLTGVFLCCQAASRPMLAQNQGVIINVSSIYGLVGPDQRVYQRPGEQAQFKPVYYSVTKAGLLGLTRYLATYYTGTNIRANALTPGGVYNGHDEAFLLAYSARTVMGRMAQKDELNGALLFLASDASTYMTGANLVVDGGWTAW
jgi:NAD(P)-dependent dehydrogenase (short-subunit alcohol dehydrogenase family)